MNNMVEVKIDAKNEKAAIEKQPVFRVVAHKNHSVAIKDEPNIESATIGWANDTHVMKAVAFNDEWYEFEDGGFSRQKFYEVLPE